MPRTIATLTLYQELLSPAARYCIETTQTVFQVNTFPLQGYTIHKLLMEVPALFLPPCKYAIPIPEGYRIP